MLVAVSSALNSVIRMLLRSQRICALPSFYTSLPFSQSLSPINSHACSSQTVLKKAHVGREPELRQLEADVESAEVVLFADHEK